MSRTFRLWDVQSGLPVMLMDAKHNGQCLFYDFKSFCLALLCFPYLQNISCFLNESTKQSMFAKWKLTEWPFKDVIHIRSLPGLKPCNRCSYIREWSLDFVTSAAHHPTFNSHHSHTWSLTLVPLVPFGLFFWQNKPIPTSELMALFPLLSGTLFSQIVTGWTPHHHSGRSS